jgi:hypothetical protein
MAKSSVKTSINAKEKEASIYPEKPTDKRKIAL